MRRREKERANRVRSKEMRRVAVQLRPVSGWLKKKMKRVPDDWRNHQMVGPLGVVVSPFRPTTRKRSGTEPPRRGSEMLMQIF